mmetsp:Transcript_121399/g.288444  ORF Transcript_121399/g.288444 Transcript_121399/m.288444 type:complete len:330 (+) Transcript_121399:759-1748(+)
MPLQLNPPGHAGTPPVALLLRHIIHHGRHDRLHSGLSQGHQKALDPHVVILCDPLHIPATNLPGQRHWQGVRRVREAHGTRVRQPCELLHRSEHSAHHDRGRLSMIVFHVEHRRLPNFRVPLCRITLREVPGQCLEVALTELRVRICHRQNCVLVGIHLADQVAEGMTDVARLARRVVGEVLWVVVRLDVFKLILEELGELLHFIFCSYLSFFHGQQDADVRLRHGATGRRSHRHRNSFDVLFVLRQDDPMLHSFGVHGLPLLKVLGAGCYRQVQGVGLTDAGRIKLCLRQHSLQSKAGKDEHVQRVGVDEGRGQQGQGCQDLLWERPC